LTDWLGNICGSDELEGEEDGGGGGELSVEEGGVYVRKRALGRGSFGSVMLVRDTRENKLYAMKTIKYDALMKDRALKEVKLLKMVKHVCIVRLHDVFITQDGGFLSVVMTYCESGDLSKQIAQQNKSGRPFSDSQILRYYHVRLMDTY